MRPLLDDDGRRALCDFAARAPLCLFDFDGTLAPLAPDPSGVLLPPALQRQLQALQQRVPVGVVTGRSLDDIRGRLDFRPDYLVGNHGLEGVPGSHDERAALARICSRWRDAMAQHIASVDPAIWLEDKRYSLSLHYLNARDHDEARAALERLFGRLQPAPRVIPGKCIYSLLPDGHGDKGQAVRQLLRFTQRDCALYVGDDVTDEDVFRLQDPRIFSIRVGRGGDSAAPWFIDDHGGMATLLALLLQCVPARAGQDR